MTDVLRTRFNDRIHPLYQLRSNWKKYIAMHLPWIFMICHKYLHYCSCIAQVYHNHCISNEITATLRSRLNIGCLQSDTQKSEVFRVWFLVKWQAFFLAGNLNWNIVYSQNALVWPFKIDIWGINNRNIFKKVCSVTLCVLFLRIIFNRLKFALRLV